MYKDIAVQMIVKKQKVSNLHKLTNFSSFIVDKLCFTLEGCHLGSFQSKIYSIMYLYFLEGMSTLKRRFWHRKQTENEKKGVIFQEYCLCPVVNMDASKDKMRRESINRFCTDTI